MVEKGADGVAQGYEDDSPSPRDERSDGCCSCGCFLAALALCMLIGWLLG